MIPPTTPAATPARRSRARRIGARVQRTERPRGRHRRREHALVLALAQDPGVVALHAAPGIPAWRPSRPCMGSTLCPVADPPSARSATAAPDIGSTSCTVAMAAMPGLPGAACSAATPGSCASASTRACSRPPVPTTRTLSSLDTSADPTCPGSSCWPSPPAWSAGSSAASPTCTSTGTPARRCSTARRCTTRTTRSPACRSPIPRSPRS